MGHTVEFSGFRKLAPADRLAGMILELYGDDAGGAARQCVDAAFADRRYDDYCYWLAVLGLIEGTGGAGNLSEVERPGQCRGGNLTAWED